MAYEFLADSYDRLTRDIPYGEILDFYQRIMALYGKTPRTVLDLACGTGSMSVLLAQAGYQVLGVDRSEQMLTVAYDKAMELKENRPYFICQPMEKLRLAQPVDCAVCCLDSLNYVTDPALCRQAIRRIYSQLKPGGLLIFDVNSEEKLRSLDGQIFLDEDDDVYCVWRADFDEARRICTYGMDIFTRAGRLWQREGEAHEEYAYTRRELTEYLEQAGFSQIRCFGDRKLTPPEENEQRLYFAATRE